MLNTRQERFAQEYWKTGHGTNSAIAAGYSKKSAHTQANLLLNNIKVQDRIKELEEQSRSELQQQFSRDAIKARKIMFNIMENDEAPEHVRLSAAKDFLDRAGFKPVEKQETTLSGGVDINEQAELINKYLKNDIDE